MSRFRSPLPVPGPVAGFTMALLVAALTFVSPAHADEPAPTDKPAKEDVPAGGDPASTDEPASSEQPATSEQPASSDQPAVAEEAAETPPADEQPADEQPEAPASPTRDRGSSAGVVPVDPSAPAPRPMPARRAEEPSKPAWSPPSSSAERTLPPENLPSPSVRDPRTGRMAQPAPNRRAALPRAPATPRSPATNRVVPPTPAPHAMTPPDAGATPAPMTPPGAPGARRRPTMTGTGSLAPVQKQHNVRLADGTIAMRMRVQFRVSGLRGGNAFLIARFIERESGTTLRATQPAFRSPSGALEIRTRPTPQAGDDGRFTADLYVPYSSFPQIPGKPSYAVDAQVRLMGDDGRNAPRELAIGVSGFRVHSGS